MQGDKDTKQLGIKFQSSMMRPYSASSQGAMPDRMELFSQYIVAPNRDTTFEEDIMPVHNSDIAHILNQVGDLLDIQGENPFRVRSYRNVARTVKGYSKNLKDMVEDDQDLTQISGVGQDMAGKISEIVETGKLQQLEDLLKETPGELSELMTLENLGPKRIKILHEKKGVNTLDDLEELAKDHEIGRAHV